MPLLKMSATGADRTGITRVTALIEAKNKFSDFQNLFDLQHNSENLQRIKNTSVKERIQKIKSIEN